MDWRKVALGHRLTSVLGNNFHVVGVTVTPNKAHTPLIVHPNTMLSLAIMGQRFESVARGHAYGIQHSGRVELFQLACGYPVNVLRQFASKLSATLCLPWLCNTNNCLGLFLGCPSYRLINDWAIAWRGDGFTTRPRSLQPHLFGLQDLL